MHWSMRSSSDMFVMITNYHPPTQSSSSSPSSSPSWSSSAFVCLWLCFVNLFKLQVMYALSLHLKFSWDKGSVKNETNSVICIPNGHMWNCQVHHYFVVRFCTHWPNYVLCMLVVCIESHLYLSLTKLAQPLMKDKTWTDDSNVMVHSDLGLP